ncbi:MAG: methyl-accepting chemotaxis protein [Spirochaetes bacterium]|nr:methyl-accepting chemotaxis protein [Spirochaetota bacterium]
MSKDKIVKKRLKKGTSFLDKKKQMYVYKNKKSKVREKFQSYEEGYINFNSFAFFLSEFFFPLTILPLLLWTFSLLPARGLMTLSTEFLRAVIAFEFFSILNALIGLIINYFILKNIFEYFNIFNITNFMDPYDFLKYRARILNFPLNNMIFYFFRSFIVLIIPLYYFINTDLFLKSNFFLMVLLSLLTSINSSVMNYYFNLFTINKIQKILIKVKIQSGDTPFKIYIFNIPVKTIFTILLPAILANLILILFINTTFNFFKFKPSSALIKAFSGIVTISAFSLVSSSLIFAFYLSDYIRILRNSIETLQKGDFTISVPVRTTDEMADFAHRLNVTSLELNNLVLQVKNFFDVISDKTNVNFEIAKKISDFSDNLNKSLLKVTESIGKITDSTKIIEKVSDNASQAITDSIKRLREQIELFEKSLSAMSEIDEISQKMVDSLKLIIDISSHTKLLALNASIEASRVGESGKGFAVVAMEIRKLAENASNVSDEIKNFIGVINNKVNQSMQGSNIIKSAVLNIMQEVSDIDNQVKSIKEEAIKEVKFTEDLSMIKDNFEKVVKENNLISGEITKNAEELKNNSDQLIKILGKLKSIETGLIIKEDQIEKVKIKILENTKLKKEKKVKKEEKLYLLEEKKEKIEKEEQIVVKDQLTKKEFEEIPDLQSKEELESLPEIKEEIKKGNLNLEFEYDLIQEGENIKINEETGIIELADESKK